MNPFKKHPTVPVPEPAIELKPRPIHVPPTLAQEMMKMTKMATIAKKHVLQRTIYPTILSGIKQAASEGKDFYFYKTLLIDFTSEEKELLCELLREDGFEARNDVWRMSGVLAQWKEKE